MSRIARLLSHSFGAKNSLERQKNPLIKRVNIGYRVLVAFQLLLVSHLDQTSNCHQADKFEFEIIIPTTRSQYENSKLYIKYVISLPPHFSLISDSEYKIKKYAQLGNRADRDNSPFKPVSVFGENVQDLFTITSSSRFTTNLRIFNYQITSLKFVVIVNVGEARVNYRFIEIELEQVF